MGKKTVFTNITPLPPQVSREVAIAMLHNHDEMIELNPLVIEHHPIKTPRDASKDEFLDCSWQEMTDRIHYLPGGIVKGKVTYKACFHDLPNGVQTHIYAPMNLDIREKWSICGTLPGEPEEARELGLNTPRRGLYLREDGEMKCNVLMTNFVRKNLDNSHKVLVERILAKAERVQVHLNSASASPDSSIPRGIPAFQPGSHMSTSSIVRSLSGGNTLQLQETNTSIAERSIPSRTSSDSAAVQSIRASLRHEFVQELPASNPEDLDNHQPLPRQPTEDEDDAEFAIVHPALREQYRQTRASGIGRSDSALPSYDKLDNQNGQYYQNDMAKRPEYNRSNSSLQKPSTKHFAVELEGSTQWNGAGESSRTATNVYGRGEPSNEYRWQPIELDSEPSARSTHAQTAYRHVTEVPEMSPRAPRQEQQQHLQHTQHQYQHQNHSDYQSRNRPQPQPTLEDNTYVSSSPVSNQSFDRYSVMSGISDMASPKTGQHSWSNGSDNRFSVVSALTEAPTPKSSQQSFAQQRREQIQQRQVSQQQVYRLEAQRQGFI